MFRRESDPRVAVGNPHHEITRHKTEGEHRLDGQSDQFRVGRRAGLAQDVHIELVELAAAAFLRFFITEALADLEPLERLREMPLVLGHQAGQRGGDFRAQRDIAPALVLETEQLPGELAPGFFQVEPGVLQDGGFVFHVATAARHRAPGLEQVIADRALAGNEIAESGKGLEGWAGHGRAARMHSRPAISRRDCLSLPGRGRAGLRAAGRVFSSCRMGPWPDRCFRPLTE